MHFHSRAVEDTHEIARCIASVTMPGDVLVLAGDLGAGKTAFVQGFAQYFAVDEPVTSPTFAIAQVYEGAHGAQLIHADVYRLGSVGELADLGLTEALDDGAIALIEWGDRIGNAVSDDYLLVSLTAHDAEAFAADDPASDDPAADDAADPDSARTIRLEPTGASWHARRVALGRACSAALLAGPDRPGAAIDSGTDPEPEKGP